MQAELSKYFDSPGFFIEAGAVDGVFESNTYFLERFENWKGILVEPVPGMFARIHVNRPTAISFNCALVSDEHSCPTVRVVCDHAMSRVASAEVDASIGEADGRYVEVPGRTLSSILDEVNPAHIDFLSLDVEGFELEALKGIDFERHRPRYILVECRDASSRDCVQELLSEHYDFVRPLSHRDYLYRSRD